MVQVIGPGAPRRPSFGEKLGSALNTGVEAYQQYQKQKQYSEGLKNLESAYGENPEQQRLIQVYRELGQHPEIARNLGSQLAGLGKNKMSSQASAAEDQKRYDVIKQNFGDRAADLYRAAPEGGKTTFLGSLLEARQRGMDVEDLLGQQPQAQQPTERLSRGSPSETLQEGQRRGQQRGFENGAEKSSIKALDYDRGLLPKERVRRQEERYSKNLPLYQESQKKLQSLDSERDRLSILEDLSPQIGSLARLNLNPQSGEIIIPAAASPEVQRYVKTLNDFTISAKDSYGSRITNFDLQQYMKRLPTLANSQEGRSQIVKQMKILNDINSTRETALQDVIDEHGGIRNIDYDRAEKLADKHSKPQIESLRKQFKALDNDLERQYQQKVKKQKAIVPKGHIAVMRTDGTQGYIPQDKLKKFLSVKGNKVL